MLYDFVHELAAHLSKTAYLRHEKSAQTTFGLSHIGFSTPRITDEGKKLLMTLTPGRNPNSLQRNSLRSNFAAAEADHRRGLPEGRGHSGRHR